MGKRKTRVLGFGLVFAAGLLGAWLLSAATVPAATVRGVTVPAVTVGALTVPGVTLPGVTLPGMTISTPNVTTPTVSTPVGDVPGVTVHGVTVAIPPATGPMGSGPGATGPGATEPMPTVSTAADPATAVGGVLRVSNSGGCGPTAFTTIGAAVSAASAGDTIIVCPGIYEEDVIVSKELTIKGAGDPTIDASNLANGLQVTASGSTVEGLTVENATDEGILVGASSAASSGSPVTGVTLAHDTVTNNDAGYIGTPGTGSGECATSTAPNAAPGDCGEGIHLNSVTDSVVEFSTVEGNAGGILLTDEFGPNSGNVIRFNTVLNNTHDCGITLASHNKPAAGPPSSFGVFDNTVEFNRVDGNGVSGQGGGILMAGGGPNTQVYGNTVTHNEASGNGLAGVVIHLHVPGSDLNDNVITFNRLSDNNHDGDFDFFPTVDPQTTDIFVASTAPLSGTVIEHNQLTDAFYGIWTLNASSSTIDDNQFLGVTTPVSNH